MGYDLNRFEGEVDEELTCPICSGVLEEPLQVSFTIFYACFISLYFIFSVRMFFKITNSLQIF